jgi:S-adenosyl methyltransferase
MEHPTWAPAGIDTERPSAARMYDYYLGGSHNFAVDRELAEKLLAVLPEGVYIARANRAFLRRAVRYCVGQGIRQLIDIGSGIPTVGNVHTVAQRADPTCRVVYVDVEPVAVQHIRALVADDSRVGAVHADLRDVDAVLGDPVTRALVDPGEPVAVLLFAVLHFVPDADDPYGIVAAYRDFAPGYLALTHGSQQDQPAPALDGMKRGERVYQRTATPFVNRDRDRIAAFFTGYDLVEPGLVTLPLWRPEGPEVDVDAEHFPAYGGVAHRPG